MRGSRTAALLAIAVLLGGCYDEDAGSPTSPDVLQAITLTLSSTSVPADGVSTVVLTAQIDPRAEPANRKLLFKAEDGAFLEATADPVKQVERTVNAAGLATATLRSSRNVRPIGVSVEVVAVPSVSARSTVEFVGADPVQTIRFVAGASSAPADGVTLTPVVVEIAPGLPSGRRTVAFTTNRGTLSATSVTANADNRARVDLKGDVVGSALLTATVDGVTVDKAFEFTPALPDAISVNPAKIRLEATTGDKGTTTVTATLTRNVGTPSRTTLAVRVVQESTGSELPVIVQGLGPTEAGKATFTLSIGALPPSSHGFAEIRVGVPGSTVVGTARIEIVAPTG